MADFTKVYKRADYHSVPEQFRNQKRQAPADPAAESTSTRPVFATTRSETTTPVESTTTTTPVPSSTSTTTSETTTAPTTSSTTTTDRESSTTTSRTTSAPESSSSSSSRTTSAPADTTVTLVVTPSTVIVVGTSTITSALAPSTIVSSGLPSSAASSSGSSGLSSGARAGIIAGSVVGGVLALAALITLCLVAKRKKRRAEDDAIRWPEIASSAEDRAALYPEQVHQTGKAGIGGDEMEEVGGGPGGNGHGGAMFGAGAAGLGAAGAYGASRWGSSPSSNSHQQPTLPTVPPSIYSSEEYGYGAPSAFTAPSAYGGYSNTPSTQSHLPAGAALAPGPASIEYQRAAAAERNTPSPPRGTSSTGHDSVPPGAGALPLPGTDMGHDEIERPRSPTDMQVGGAFGHGYDEGDGGKRWRLSVVNDDPRDR